MSRYRLRILRAIHAVLEPHKPLRCALDFGAGNGWFAQRFREEGLAREVVPVDVTRRRRSVVEPVLYDGRRLPFADRSFDLVYAIDVLHHCSDPRASLKDLLRCCKQYFLLKDHTYSSWVDWLALCVLDEVGNRRFGIPSRHMYQAGWEWLRWIEDEGLVLGTVVHPAVCHEGLLGRATNGLQFIALAKRELP